MYVANRDSATPFYPKFATSEEIITKFYKNVMGRDSVDAGGMDYWSGQLKTKSVGTVVFDMITALLNSPDTNPVVAASKALFNNKTSVGLTYALGGGDDPILAAQINAAVTATDTTAAMALINAANAVVLTNGIDIKEGNVFNSKPVYTPDGGDFINSLQDEDILTGKGANATLNVTIGSVNDSAETVIAPKLTNIPNVNVEYGSNGSGGLNFQDTKDVKNLSITRITSNAATVTMDNLDAGTTNLAVSNATRGGVVNFNYREDTLTSTTDTVNLALANTRLSTLRIQETGDSTEDRGYGFETVNINVSKTSNIDSLVIEANAREDISKADANQTINLVVGANAATEINLLNANGAEFINITASSEVMIAADERNTLTDLNNGINSAELRKMVITGAGDVTIDGLDGHIDETLDINGEKGTTLVVDASAMTGSLKLGVKTAADANLSSTLANRSDKDVSITSGSGNDIIETYTALAGDITTNDGDDLVHINNGSATPTNLNVEGVSTISTGAGKDTVKAANLLATAGDQADGNSSFGQVTAAVVLTGDGDDTVEVDSLLNDIDWDNGSLKDSNVDDLFFVKGAMVDTGAGNDTVYFDVIAEGASVVTGEGNDTVGVELTGGLVLGGDNDSKAEVNLDKTVNALGAILDLGAGDDVANFVQVVSLGLVNTQIVGTDAELRAGAGNDTLNVEALDGVTVVTNTTWTSATVNDVNANVFGIETANLTIDNQINAATAAATGLTENDNLDTDGQITVDVMRFDSALKAINLDSQEKTLLQSAGTEIYEAGTATSFTLNNLREDIALTLKANEATGVTAGALKDDEAIDVNLTVSNAEARGQADSFTLNIASGSEAFDLNLQLNPTLTDKVANDASKTDDDDKAVEKVVINLAADDKGHYINFNNFGDASHATDTSEEGSKVVATSLTVNGGVAGTTLVLDNVSADTITATGAANVKVKVSASGATGPAGNNFVINTGSGNDVINMMADDVRANNATDDATDLNTEDNTDEGDAINAGAGNDRVIINGNDVLGSDVVGVNGRILGGRTDDDVFAKIKSVESLEIKDGGANWVTLDEAAATSGANLQNIYITGTGAQDTTIQIGENFGNDSGTVKNTLTIDSTKDLSGDKGGAAKNASLTLTIDNQDTDQDTDLVNLNVIVGMAQGTDINFYNTGDEKAVVNVTATVGGTANTVGTGLAATAGNLSLDITNGSIDKVTLLDFVGATKTTENAAITVNVSNSWSKTAFELDASAVGNTDFVSATVTNSATGGMTFNGATELDAKLTVKGTQNDDTITGSNQDDTLFGNDGNDVINGGLGNDTIDGGNGNDIITGGVGIDTITGGAGDDTITGGAGADALTGGAGKDTFIYNAVSESNGDGADSIADFVSGTDKISVNGVVAGSTGDDFINLASFATVATAGDGDNSLLGTTVAPVMGDAYYATDSKQLVIDINGDGDITTAADLVIQSPGAITAADINYTLTAGAGNDFIRGGQGVDNLDAGAGNDTFVVVGSLSAVDASGYSTLYGAGANSTAVLGGALAAQESKVLRATELLSTRSITEVRSGDVYNGGADNDTMHVFGTADFTGATISNIETAVIHSSVTFTIAQIMSFGTVSFEGNIPHSIVIVKNDGTALTQAEQLAVLAAVPVVQAVAGTITVGGTTYADQTALLNAVNSVGAAGQPAVSTQADLSASDDTAVNNDNVTSQTTGLTFTGYVNGTVAAANIVVFNDADNDGVHDASEVAFTGLTVNTAEGVTAWTVDAPTLANGTHNIRAYTTNANGLRSDLSTNLAVTVDNVAPTAAGFDNPVAGDNQINMAERTATVTITGTNEAGATTTINGNAVQQSSPTTWQYVLTTAAINAMVPGNNTLTAVTTDLAGNSTTSTKTVFVDLVAPTAPGVATVATDDVINIVERDATVTITGTNEAGATTTVSATGIANAAVTQTSPTTWSYTLSAAQINAFGQFGETLTIVSTDSVGNTSTTTKNISVDTVAPGNAAANFVATDNWINIVESGSIQTVTGTNESGVTVTVAGNTASVTGGTFSGSFSVAQIAAMAQGANTFNIVSTDAAGNVTTNTMSVNKDTIAPVAATFNAVAGDGVINLFEATGGVVLTGTNEAGAVTTLSATGLSNVAVTQSTPTTWTRTLTLAEVQAFGPGAETLTLTSTDAAGNPTTSTVNVSVDIVVPTVSTPAFNAGASTGVANAAYYNAGDVIAIDVATSEVVTVTGTPQLTLTIGATTVQANYASGSGTNSLRFTYTIQPGQTDVNGLSIGVNSLSLPPGAGIADAAGNPATVTHVAVADNMNFIVDTTAPTFGTIAIASATGVANATVNAGDVLTINVPVSENVTVTGAPTLGLNIGGTTVQATFNAGASTATNLVFNYTILAAQTDVNGISIDANSFSLNGGTVLDNAGNGATITHLAVADNAGYKVDTTAPTANITAATDDVNGVTGVIATGGTTNDSVLVLSGTNETGGVVEVFNGAVSLGFASVVGNAWSFNATVADATTYNFNVKETDLAGNVSTATANYVITGDLAAPAVAITGAADNVGTIQGNIASAGLTDDSTLVLSGTCEAGATVSVRDGLTVLGAATVVGTTWSYTATVGNATYNFNAIATDAAGNSSAATANYVVTGDVTAPTLLNATIAYNNNGTAANFADDTWTVTMSEAFTIANSTQIQLYNATQGNYATVVVTTGPGNTLVLTTVGGSAPGNWAATDTIDISIGAGGIADTAGNVNVAIGLAGGFTPIALI
jgi:Ca2+-binding RTX toxin-like protein